jgi:hypothetical protein
MFIFPYDANALLTGPTEQSKLVVNLRSKPQACGA